MQSLEFVHSILFQYISFLSESQDQITLLLSLLGSVYMLAIIWIIQLIHYPRFIFVNPNEFVNFHQKHTLAMSILVGPIMVIELLCGLWLLKIEMNLFSIFNLILILLLWIFTFLVSVPLHKKLSINYDIKIIKKLILTNWPRTILWTLKFCLISLWYLLNYKYYK